MSDSAKKFMNISVWITIFLFVIRCLIDSSGIASAISESILIVAILFMDMPGKL